MSIFNDFLSGSRMFVSSRTIGTFAFDIVTSEAHQSNLRLTKNPVESGAAIADHSVLEPKEVTVYGIMVGYTPPQYLNQATGYELSGMLKQFPLPLSVQAVTDQAIGMVNRYASMVVGAIESIARPLAPWLPDGWGFGLDSSATLDRIGKAYEDLLALQKKGEPLEVQTGIRLYKNMMITGIAIVQQKDGSAEFGITLEEVFIVDTVIAGGLSVKSPIQTSPAGASKSGRSKEQAAPTKQHGKTQPKPKEGSKSGLAHGRDWFKNL